MSIPLPPALCAPVLPFHICASNGGFHHVGPSLGQSSAGKIHAIGGKAQVSKGGEVKGGVYRGKARTEMGGVDTFPMSLWKLSNAVFELVNVVWNCSNFDPYIFNCCLSESSARDCCCSRSRYCLRCWVGGHETEYACQRQGSATIALIIVWNHCRLGFFAYHNGTTLHTMLHHIRRFLRALIQISSPT